MDLFRHSKIFKKIKLFKIILINNKNDGLLLERFTMHGRYTYLQ